MLVKKIEDSEQWLIGKIYKFLEREPDTRRIGLGSDATEGSQEKISFLDKISEAFDLIQASEDNLKKEISQLQTSELRIKKELK